MSDLLVGNVEPLFVEMYSVLPLNNSTVLELVGLIATIDALGVLALQLV